MIKLIYLSIFVLLIAGCSLNKNSKFWTSSQNITEENLPNYKKIFEKEKVLENELNPSLRIKLSKKINKNFLKKNYFNNDGRLNYDGDLKRSSRYKFSKISNFNQFEPNILFNKKNVFFFDNNGSILKFNEKSKLVWKKNYYSKSEKKLKPILQLANNQDFLIVADNIAKYFSLVMLKPSLTKTMLHGWPASPVCFVTKVLPSICPVKSWTSEGSVKICTPPFNPFSRK